MAVIVGMRKVYLIQIAVVIKNIPINLSNKLCGLETLHQKGSIK